MTNQQVHALLTRIGELQESALEQPAPDYASYLERVGRYRGLKEAIQILSELDKDEDD